MVRGIDSKIFYKKRLVQGLLSDMEKIRTKVENLRKGIQELIQMRRIYRR